METIGGKAPDGRKVKGTIHWVSATESIPAEFRRYKNLFEAESVGARTGNYEDDLCAESVQVFHGNIEPSVRKDDPSTRYQFERNGYFCRDHKSEASHIVFNEIIGLRDSWAKTKLKSEPVRLDPVPVKKAEVKKNERAPRPTKRTPAQLRDLKRRESPALQNDFQRYQSDVGLTEHDADILTGSETLNALFAGALKTATSPTTLSKWFTNVLPALLEPLSDAPAVEGQALADVIELIESNTISSTSGKEVAIVLLTQGGDANEVVNALNLAQVSDEASLSVVLNEILEANPGKVAAVEAGRTQLAGFFIGQVMRAMPNANPQMVQQLVQSHFNL
jgi:glutaminyl-tRNA synthetase